ncbi:aldose epimerase [Cupriavidus plantarum]|uniref:aldose epimerase family protein n=1 Tax=Cupriavidus plantarum TaxID=942865 RepID=UPI000EB0039B|nr:aldose epimerase [Cupriavidus plantarum]NYH98097.1 aldose 1-epimerase [Cupriavidus plantarum]RLK35472.1 aldose 1-epimerase [Cupriavidus plantarum]
MTTAMTQRFQGQDLLRIGAGDSYLLLAPEHGGRLVRWVHRGEDILYWPDNADWTRVAKVRGGNPLLFPFIGRHFVDGEAGKWRDADGVVRDMPQHGFARDVLFTVSEASDDAVTLMLTPSAATEDVYPFAFTFAVIYRLDDQGLQAVMRITNRGNTALPWYAGHHFYFRVPHTARAASRLHLPAAPRVRQTADGGLTPPESGASQYALDDTRLQDTFHVLASPRQECSLVIKRPDAPPRTIRLSLTATCPWHAITTWTELPTSDFYCVEPWTGLPNAIGHGQGLHWLPGGASVEAGCALAVE